MSNIDVCSFRLCSFLLLCAPPSWRRKQDRAQLVLMFLSILTTGDQSLSLPELEHTTQALAAALGFFVLGTKAAWTRPLSDLRVQMCIPKRGISKPMRYNTKGLRVCFRDGLICLQWSELSCVSVLLAWLGGSFNTLCNCREVSLCSWTFTHNNFGSPAAISQWELWELVLSNCCYLAAVRDLSLPATRACVEAGLFQICHGDCSCPLSPTPCPIS